MKNNQPLLTATDFPDNVLTDDQEQLLIRRRLNDWLLLARDSKPENTLKAYRQDWQHFFNWCQSGQSFVSDDSKSKQALPASIDTLIDYIKYWVGIDAPATLRRRLSSISKIHSVSGATNPLNDELVKESLKIIGRGYKKKKSNALESKTFYELKLNQLEKLGIENTKLHSNLAGDQHQAKGLTWSHLLKIKELLPVKFLVETDGFSVRKAQAARRQNGIWLKHARDRAIIHCAFDSMLRVSELISLRVGDVEFHGDGSALLKIGKRKDNQEGEIAKAYLAVDTVKEIKRWLSMSELISGSLFCSLTKSGRIRTDKVYDLPKPLKEGNVLDLYKSIADKIGESSSLFSCHSTRVGAAQDMLEENIGMLAVKQAGRWKSDRMPSRYGKDIDAKRGGMAQLSMKKNRN